jgi:multidrug resistance protein MdtO
MALVVRMMVAATLVMIVSMTFKLPQGAYGAVYALTLSRESPRATISAVKVVVVAFAIAAAWELNGAIFFTNEPVLRFGWLILTFFLMFYCLSALTNYTAAVRFGYLVIITTPLWDRHLSAETRVEQTLWAVWTLTVASLITVFVELIYAEFNRGSDLIKPISERLSCVENALLAYAHSRPVPQAAEKGLTRFAMAGMSRLRRTLQRSSYPSEHREQMGAVLTIVGRMVDIAANLMHLGITVTGIDRQRMLGLVENIASIRTDLEAGRAPANIQFDKDRAMSSVPLLREMGKTVALIPDVFLGCESLKAYGPPPAADEPRAGLFRPDALSNADHIKFALKGGLAASLCYVIYNVIDWPGISTAVTTCFLTAQSTIGSSRQKQLLRIAGAIVGGLILGFGAQIFILPHLDSIAEFTVLFLAVTFIAAWFATSSPRLSYFGIQIAVAWYLINLQEFKIQTSLGVARDRVFGIFLGLMVMWLIFDQLWGAPAGVEMRRAFISNVRLLAQFIREPLSNDVGKSIDRNYALRETINAGFDKARFLADGVLLEFGPSRQPDLALRSRIRQWQTQLRVISSPAPRYGNTACDSPASSCRTTSWRHIGISMKKWQSRWTVWQIEWRAKRLIPARPRSMIV